MDYLTISIFITVIIMAFGLGYLIGHAKGLNDDETFKHMANELSDAHIENLRLKEANQSGHTDSRHSEDA